VLLVTLSLIFLVSSILLFIHLQLIANMRTVVHMEGRLHSLVLAQNGVEAAKAILVDNDVNDLLAGADGTTCRAAPDYWPNPIDLDSARTGEIGGLTGCRCDDGIPSTDHIQRVGLQLARADSGRFFVRFSNDRSEPPSVDQNRIVQVRSVGLCRSLDRSETLPGFRNHVTVIEAVLRREEALLLPAPLNLAGKRGDFQFSGSRFRVQASGQPAVALIDLDGALMYDFQGSLLPDQHRCFSGLGPAPSVVRAETEFRNHPQRQVLMSSDFWDALIRRLPTYAQPISGTGSQHGLVLAEGDQRLSGRVRGILFASGDLELHGGAEVTGLIVHLGGGRLTLRDASRVRGAVWASNPALDNGIVKLGLLDASKIIYSAEAVEEACRYLPVTQLGWRVVFPEMN
jgi:hypothetical protein